MSFYQLFLANLKILFRNARGIFFNLIMPVGLFVIISKLINVLPGKGAGAEYAQFLLPGMIAMTIMQTGIFSIAYWLIDVRSTGVLKRFQATPVSALELAASVIGSRIVLIFMQVAALSMIGWKVFGLRMHGSITALILLIILGAGVCLSIGFMISNIAKNYEEAAPFTAITNLLFTFLGNIFFSTEKMPGFLKEVSNILPVTYLSKGLRENYANSIGFTKSAPEIIALFVWMVALLAVNAWLLKRKTD